MIYKVLSIYYLHLFLHRLLFPFWDNFKNRCFLERLRVCVVVFIHEKENWQCFYRLWHATLHHALITCSNVSRAGKGNIA